MNRPFAYGLLLLVGMLLLQVPRAAEQTESAAGAPTAFLLAIDGPIGPAISDYVRRGLQHAREHGARAVSCRWTRREAWIPR